MRKEDSLVFELETRSKFLRGTIKHIYFLKKDPEWG